MKCKGLVKFVQIAKEAKNSWPVPEMVDLIINKINKEGF